MNEDSTCSTFLNEELSSLSNPLHGDHADQAINFEDNFFSAPEISTLDRNMTQDTAVLHNDTDFCDPKTQSDDKSDFSKDLQKWFVMTGCKINHAEKLLKILQPHSQNSL